MCTVKMYKTIGDKTCQHRWLEIDTPCHPGRGFTTCPIFRSNGNQLSLPPKRIKGKKEDCPWHGLKGNYDLNVIRMVEGVKYHVFGVPGGEDGDAKGKGKGNGKKKEKDEKRHKMVVCGVM